MTVGLLPPELSRSTLTFRPRGRQQQLRRAGDGRGVRFERSPEFAELRPYAAGDDVRQLDWAATARTGVPFVRRTVAPRSSSVAIFLDQTASMAVGEGDTAAFRPIDAAAAVCEWLATLAIRQGGDVTLDRFPNAVGEVPLKTRSSATLNGWLQDRVCGGEAQPADAATPVMDTTKLADSLVVVISDFASNAAGWENWFASHQGYDVIAVQVGSDAGVPLNVGGPVMFVDAETGETLEANVGHLAADYRDSFATRQRQLLAAARRSMIEFWPIHAPSRDELAMQLASRLADRERRLGPTS